jgi:uncharacterized protein YbaR (Trm112 family)
VASQALPDDLLQTLVDPLTREALRLATPEQLASLGRALARGTARRRGGGTSPQPLDGALVGADGRAAYPIVAGLPHLLVDERIELDEPLG